MHFQGPSSRLRAPAVVHVPTSAPCATSALAVVTCPLMVASPNGVRPRLLRTWDFAPPTSSASDAASCPALCNVHTPVGARKQGCRSVLGGKPWSRNKCRRGCTCSKPLIDSEQRVVNDAFTFGNNLDNCSNVRPGSKVQRGIVGSVKGVNPGPLIEQHAYGVSMAIQGSQMQRCPPTCATASTYRRSKIGVDS